MPLHMRLPKLRGPLAKTSMAIGPFRTYMTPVNLSRLSVFEAGGDWQLTRFRKDPANRGKVLDTGLWRYTRHPNYFGNACLWWGIWLVAVDATGTAWTAIGPAVMTWMLLRVSGVTLLEASLRKSRPGYEDYVRRTSPFFPLPPKKD